MVVARVFALTSLAAGVSAASSGNNAIGKVVGLLKELRNKAQVEGEEDTILNTKFVRWCKNYTEKYGSRQEANAEKIEELGQTIDGLTASIASLNGQITGATNRLEAGEKQLATLKKNYEAQDKVYEQEENDLDNTVSAVKTALKTVVESEGKLSGGNVRFQQMKAEVRRVAALMQPFMSAQDNHTVRSFLQQPQENTNPVSYRFKSGSIIELLKSMQASFEKELTNKNTERNRATNAHDLAAQAQTDANTATQTKLDKLNGELETAEGDKKQATSDLDAEQKDYLANQAALGEGVAECKARQAAFGKRHATREEEMGAIEMAIKILTTSRSGRAAASTVKDSSFRDDSSAHDAATSFVQVSSMKPEQKKAAAVLAALAKNSNSAALKLLASRVTKAKKEGAFVQIVNTIQKMVFQLNKEQTDEDNHKAWCDTEWEQTMQDLNVKKGQKKALDDKIALLTTDIDTLTGAIEDAEGRLEDAHTDLNNATAETEALKKELASSVKDAQVAIMALNEAVETLSAYYNGSKTTDHYDAEAGSSDLGRDGEDGGMGSDQDAAAAAHSENSGKRGDAIIKLLETTHGDYTTMEAELRSAETEREETYAKFRQNKEQEIQKEETTISLKTGNRSNKEAEKASAEERQEQKEKQIYALEVYQEDLGSLLTTHKADAGQKQAAGGNCRQYEGDKDVTDERYDNRKALRNKEIEGLKTAEKFMQDAIHVRQNGKGSFLAKRRV